MAKFSQFGYTPQSSSLKPSSSLAVMKIVTSAIETLASF